MATDTTYLIVGASLAGAKAAQTLREQGFDGPLVLIGEERERPAGLPALRAGVLLAAVGQAAGGRSPAAAAAVGVDVDQGSGLSRHPLCG